jgi:hypothetical protein
MVLPIIFTQQIPWCRSWWHKVRYGSNKVETDSNTTEYFCKKCGGKTGGYTTFSITIELIK